MHRRDGSGCEADHTSGFFFARSKIFFARGAGVGFGAESADNDTTVPRPAGKGLAPSVPPMLSLAKS